MNNVMDYPVLVFVISFFATWLSAQLGGRAPRNLQCCSAKLMSGRQQHQV